MSEPGQTAREAAMNAAWQVAYALDLGPLPPGVRPHLIAAGAQLVAVIALLDLPR